jgi:hypothetical protein
MLSILFAACTASAEKTPRWAIEIFAGGAVNLDTTMKIEQSGHPDIEFDAQYETRPFDQPLYWVARFDWLRKSSRWEIQLIHHKIYLANNPPEVQHFEVTHGYNLLTANRVFLIRHVTVRAGAGVVLAHTESTVRGLKDDGTDRGILDTGYELAGPVIVGGAGRPFPVTAGFFVTPELQLSVAWAKVTVAGGHATAANVAVHLLFGVGYGF